MNEGTIYIFKHSGTEEGFVMAQRILLTGGSGDLGTLLTSSLIEHGDTPVILDLAKPQIQGGEFIQGSIIEREIVNKSMTNIDIVVHIAAWHGVHENEKTPDEFYDLNVTGTYNVLEAAAQAGVKKFIFISSTSVSKPYDLYGHTKILGEEMMRAYAHRHDMDIIILRPRAFIPGWNKTIYRDFVEWAKWFWNGAVHINDVVQAVTKSINYLKRNHVDFPPPTLPIDGKYDYSDDDLNNWDKKGLGSTFKKHYSEYLDIALRYDFDIARKPRRVGSDEARKLIGYEPTYSIRNMLNELKQFKKQGPKRPF